MEYRINGLGSMPTAGDLGIQLGLEGRPTAGDIRRATEKNVEPAILNHIINPLTKPFASLFAIDEDLAKQNREEILARRAEKKALNEELRKKDSTFYATKLFLRFLGDPDYCNLECQRTGTPDNKEKNNVYTKTNIDID